MRSMFAGELTNMRAKWILPSGLINQNAALAGGIRGALWLPSYLRRDATALGLMLLSIRDITSSFQ